MQGLRLSAIHRANEVGKVKVAARVEGAVIGMALAGPATAQQVWALL
ncbi:MAG: hypothetical protein ACE5FA_13610 [Dehalococcoidia bacterium]